MSWLLFICCIILQAHLPQILVTSQLSAWGSKYFLQTFLENLLHQDSEDDKLYQKTRSNSRGENHHPQNTFWFLLVYNVIWHWRNTKALKKFKISKIRYLILQCLHVCHGGTPQRIRTVLCIHSGFYFLQRTQNVSIGFLENLF